MQYTKKILTEIISLLRDADFDDNGLTELSNGIRMMKQTDTYCYMFVEAFGVRITYMRQVGIIIDDPNYAGEQLDLEKWKDCVIESVKNNINSSLTAKDFYINR